MKLLDLDPQFIRLEQLTNTVTKVVGDPLTWKSGDPTQQVTELCDYHHDTDDFTQADGIMFLCPLCYRTNGGASGTHRVLCWFKGRVPDNVKPGPGRWAKLGSGYHDLTLGPGNSNKSSVQLTAGCMWHGHVMNGDVTFE